MAESLPWVISTFAVLAVLGMTVWNLWRHPKQTPRVLPDPDIESRFKAVEDALASENPEKALSEILNDD